MNILFCIATAKPDFAVLFSGPPHTQCPATSRCGGVSVCFLCGSLCGLLLAALCGPLCCGPLLDRRHPLAAFRSSFSLRHSFSACRPPPPLRCSCTESTLSKWQLFAQWSARPWPAAYARCLPGSVTGDPPRRLRRLSWAAAPLGRSVSRRIVPKPQLGHSDA